MSLAPLSGKRAEIWHAIQHAGDRGLTAGDLVELVYDINSEPENADASVRCQVQRLKLAGYPVDSVRRGRTVFYCAGQAVVA